VKAVFVRDGGGVEVREVDVPEIGDGELLVKMVACGVDGTDLEKAFGRPLTPPMLGHEVVGVVEESRAEMFRKGDRVFVHHRVSCGACYYCLNGSHTMCPEFLKDTIKPCGFAEYFRVPRANVERGGVLRLPDGLDWLEASFIEPAACVLRALRRVGFSPGNSVALVGAGPTGMIFVKLLKVFGASVVVVAELSQFRRMFAEKAGADVAVNPLEQDFSSVCRKLTDGRGCDVGVLATPAIKPIHTVLEAVRRGGKVCLFGAPERGEKTEIDFSQLFIDEKSIVTSYSTSESETTKVLEMMSRGRISLKELVTHRFRLGEAGEAFAAARDASRSVKVVVEG
jgi:L-iditol 2-dehydrogenase